ncbi:hypothetical protein OG948_33045 [Embleya sp. NBC_00888]|uniref:hypothetical protein n=1 Tax=Embleya sp. NBC_00888 TaxID=2975960 RepID=UPI00386372D3|nr:hypothetical protein OG948_33045 [Embleya sp. NBC_00888]
MDERDDDASWDELRREWEALAALGEAVPELGIGSGAQGSPFPEDLRRCPLVLCVAPEEDPASLLAVVAAARRVPELIAVVVESQYASMVRALLTACDRRDVTVTARAADVVTAVDGRIRWVGTDNAAPLLSVCEGFRDVATRLRVTQVVPANASSVGVLLSLLSAEGVPAPELVPRSLCARALTVQPGESLHLLLGRNLLACAGLAAIEVPEGWWARTAKSPIRLTAALALSAAIELPYLDSDLLEWPGQNRMPWTGVDVHTDAFIQWLHQAVAIPRS